MNSKFQTINNTLCRMVEPEPLTDKVKFPVVVEIFGKQHILQDKYQGFIPVVFGATYMDMSLNQAPFLCYLAAQIIGYPVVDGSAEWALYQMMQGKDIIHGAAKSFRRLDTFSETEIRVSDAEGEVLQIVSFDKFLAEASPTGWQLYEPKPLLADAKVGDLCKTDLDEWIQIDDTSEPPSPILYHFDRPFNGNIIYTEPLATKGSAEWAGQMLKLGCPVKHDSFNDYQEKRGLDEVAFHTSTITSPIDSWIHNVPKIGWQIYAEKPLLAEARKGDLCQRRDGKWVQIDSLSNDRPCPIMCKSDIGGMDCFTLDGRNHNAVGDEKDIISTEPLAPEGTAEWAWQMLMLGKTVYNPLRYYSSSHGFITSDMLGNGSKQSFVDWQEPFGWQLYEPKPLPMASTHDGLGDKFLRDCLKPNEHPIITGCNRFDYVPVEGIRIPKEPEPAYAVGDWVELNCYNKHQGKIKEMFTETYEVDGLQLYSFPTFTITGLSGHFDFSSITRKLPPSEVRVKITLEGTVQAFGKKTKGFWLICETNPYAVAFADIDPTTASLVRELLAKQKEEK